MSRKTHVYVLVAVATAFCVGAVGCSGSNDPATPAGAGAPTASAGATAAAGASNVAGAAAAGAPSGAAGAATGSAGSASAGAPSAGAGGATAAGGAAGAAGASSTGGATGGMFTPLCTAVPLTAAGVAPAKGGACTAGDPQLCYKGCGPQNSGFKSETCTAGLYAEQSGCTFPADSDYGCFKIPTTQDATCPTTTITASMPCTTNMCTVCSDATGHYYDSGNNLKVGYCVCPAPGASGTSKWSCASNTAWPCPTGKGC
jgi:hypothetical protein